MTMTAEERMSVAREGLERWLNEGKEGTHRIDDAIAEVVGWLEDLQDSFDKALGQLSKVVEEDASGWDKELVQFPASKWDALVTSREGLDQAVAELRQTWIAALEELTA